MDLVKSVRLFNFDTEGHKPPDRPLSPSNEDLNLQKQIERLKDCLKTLHVAWDNLRIIDAHTATGRGVGRDRKKPRCEMEEVWNSIQRRIVERRHRYLGQAYAGLLGAISDQTGFNEIEMFAYPVEWWDSLDKES